MVQAISQVPVVGFDWSNKVTGYESCSLKRRNKELFQSFRLQSSYLMNELIEGVLAVGTGLPPHDGAGAVADTGPGPGHVLPVALHVTLLEVGREPVHILIIGQYGMRIGIKEIVIPNYLYKNIILSGVVQSYNKVNMKNK